ncbi:helix-turn-helix domain-containing protein [Shigella sonnei]|nr:helix-turn-helix domain-containing protein [Shigella sonnei]
MQNSTIGQRLAFIREQILGVNRTQLADMLEVTPSSISKIEKDQQSDISATTAFKIEHLVEAHGYNAHWLMFGGPRPADNRRIPIVGNTQAGPDTIWFDCGHANGTADAYIDFPSNGQTYGLMVVGSSMDPFYREGEAVIVDPKVEPVTGEVVVVRMRDDEVMLKVFTGIRDGNVVLDSLNSGYDRQLRKLEEVAFMHLVVGKVTGSRIMKSVE